MAETVFSERMVMRPSIYDAESHILVGKIINICADEKILNEEGKIDPAKLRPITFDAANRKYIVLGEIVGNAFGDGNALK